MNGEQTDNLNHRDTEFAEFSTDSKSWSYFSGDQSGQISTEPYFAVGIFSAQRIASSRSLHSSTEYPPTCSCVSAKGPSVVRVAPFRMRTVVGVAEGASPPFESSTPAAVASSI